MAEIAKGDGGSAGESVVKLACQNCLRTTNHVVVQEHKEREYIKEAGIEFGDEYQIVRCKGCENISFRHAAWNTDDIDLDSGELIARVNAYPYRLAGRKTMDGLGHLPPVVRNVYEETHTCLAANAQILGTIGIRAVVEAVCNDKKAAGKRLEEKIDDLVKQGWLSPKQTEFLHESRVLGNEAAHEMKPPDQATLSTALNIVENLLQTVYVLPGTLASKNRT